MGTGQERLPAYEADEDKITVYFHDEVEVRPKSSWTGLCPPLRSANRIHFKEATSERVLNLFDYARPDAVITKGGVPIVSIEQTKMNPSGHNIPQRFSFHVRAAELSVPSILYYPEHSKRTFSDPNERYLQVRVPLAQKRLSSIFGVPGLSIFWPTNEETKLPDGNLKTQTEIAQLVEELLENTPSNPMQLKTVRLAFAKMDAAVDKYASTEGDYDSNPSVRRLMPSGFPSSRTPKGVAIDPPNKSKLSRTSEFIESLRGYSKRSYWSEIEEKLREREYTLAFYGTANKKKNDSEHPWPGYLTLLDILYLRKDNGKSKNERIGNLVYSLPVKISTFLARITKLRPPAMARIVDSFADLIVLDGGLIAGKPMRGVRKTEPIGVN